MVYSPGEIPAGTVYWKVAAPVPAALAGRLPGTSAGQPPSIDLMTIHFELFVGCRSVVRLTWQDPPPWTALPMKLRVCGSPTAMTLDAPSASYTPVRCLQ